MFWKFESLNSVILCIGGCQSEKSPFSARYEDGKALLWRRMVCGSVTDIYLLICDSCAHMTVTIKTKLHTLSGICE